MLLTVEVSFQFYGETEEDQREVAEKVRDTLVQVVGLCDLAVGTFVKSEIVTEESSG